MNLVTETALSVGIEPTSTTQYHLSQQRLFEYKVDNVVSTMLQRNFGSVLASTAKITLKVGTS